MIMVDLQNKTPVHDADFPSRGGLMAVLLAVDSARQKADQAHATVRQAITQLRAMAPGSVYLAPLCQLDWRLQALMDLDTYKTEVAALVAAPTLYRAKSTMQPTYWEPSPVLPTGLNGVLIYGIGAEEQHTYGRAIATAFCIHPDRVHMKYQDGGQHPTGPTTGPVLYLTDQLGPKDCARNHTTEYLFDYVAGVLGIPLFANNNTEMA
jgi:hypothetical protein